MKTITSQISGFKLMLALAASAFVAQMAGAANKVWDGGGGDNFWLTGANWDANTPPASGDSLIFTTTTRLLNTNNFPAATGFGGIAFNSPAGAFTIWGSAISLDGNITNNQVLVTETINLPMSLSANRTVHVVDDAALTLGGAVSGGFGLTKTGDGLLTLSAANTFAGPITSLAGVIGIGSDGNLGTVPLAATPGNLILNGGALRSTATLTLHANRGIALGPTIGNGSGRIEVNSGATVTYAGILANNGSTGGLTKAGPGTLTLSSANTYTGPTSNRVGNLTLDFTTAGSPANDIISSTSALSLGGENTGVGIVNNIQVTMNGKAAVVNNQTFNGTSFDVGHSVVRANSGAGGTANLVLGSLGHLPGGVITFTPPKLNAGLGDINTTSANVNGILGGWATISSSAQVVNGIPVATNWATVDASGNIVPYTNHTIYPGSGTIAAIAGSDKNIIFNTSGGPGSSVRVDVDHAPGAGTTTDINTLTINPPNPASTVNRFGINIGSNNVLRLGKFGGIFLASVPSVADQSYELGNGTDPSNNPGANAGQNVGTLTAGGAPNTDGELVFTVDSTSQTANGSIYTEVAITDNGSGKVSVVKTGPGPMKFRGHNSFSGNMYILQGRIQMAGSELPGGAATTANPDAFGRGDIYVLPGGQAFPSGAGGNATMPAITNNWFLAGNGVSDNVGSIRFPNAGIFSNAVMTLIGDTRLGGGGFATGLGGQVYNKITGDFNLDFGATGNSGGGANGAILYNHQNDWRGDTSIVGRTGSAGNSRLILGNNEVIPDGFGKGNLILGNTGNNNNSECRLDLNGFNETVNGLVSFVGNEAIQFIENRAAGTTSILSVGNNDASSTFGGTILDNGGVVGITKIGGGALTLSGANAYSGSTIVNGGTLALTGGGSIASSQEIVVNGATFDVAGMAAEFTAGGPVRANNSALVLNAVNVNAPALNLTNAGLAVTLDPAEINLRTTTLTTGGGTNRINISSVVNVAGYPTGPITVIDYDGVIGGAGYNFGLGTVPSPVTVGYVSNDVANSRVVVVLLNGPKPLTWRGNSGPNWDEGITENWLAFNGTANEEPASFFMADAAFFDDTGETNRVNLIGALSPGGIAVNNTTLNYSFTGPGFLTGLGGITKEGAGALVIANTGLSDNRGGITLNGGSLTLATDNAIAGGLSVASGTTVQVGTNGNSGNLPAGIVNNEGSLIFNRGSAAYTANNRIAGNGTIAKNDTGILTLSGNNNTFTGAVTVASGTLKVGIVNALGTADGGTTVNSGATLDINAINLVTEPVTVSGAGVGGAGAIINGNATGQNDALGNVTLTGHTTFGGTGRWDIRGGAASLSTGGAAYNLTKVGNNQVSLVGVTVDGALGNIIVSNGIISVETTTSGLGAPGSTLTVYTNGTLQIFNTATPLDKVFQLYGNGLTNTISVASGANNSIIGAVTLNGGTVFNFGGAFGLALNGTVGGPGSLLMRGAGTLTLNGAVSYAGNTTIAAGTLVLNSINSGGGTLTNATGTFITGHGTNTGAARLTGTLLPGGTNVAGPFGTGNLTISNLNATFDLATADYNNVSPANDAVFSSGTLTLQGTNTLTMNPVVSGVLTNTQVITLIQYNGALTGGSNNLRIVSPLGYVLRLLDPATTPNAIQVVVDKSPLNLAWRGGAASNPTAWDVFNTTNWLNAADNSTPAIFTNYDNVTFSDTQNTNFVALTGTLQPGAIVANNAAVTYTLGGTGRLTGSAPLTAQGGGTFIIANTGSNDLTGAVNINSGTLQIGNGGTGGNLGPGSITNQGNLVFNRTGTLTANNIHGSGSLTNDGPGVVTLGGVNTYDGTLAINQGTIRAASASALGSVTGPTVVAGTGTLDVNGQTLNLEQVNVRGEGVGGNGAIVNHGADSLNALFNVILDGHTTFGGTNRWDIRGGASAASLSTGGQAYNLTKVGAGQFSLVNVVVDSALADINVQAGTFSSETTTTGLGDPTRNFTLTAGATWQIFNSATSWDKRFLLTGNGVANTINVSSGTGNNIIGPVTLTGPCLINITAANELAVPGPNAVDGTGSLAKNGTGTLNLSGPLNYAGTTTVNGGTLRVSGAAALTNSPVVTVGAGASLDVSFLADGPTLRRLNGQTLMGNGNINGSVNIAAGATLAPGLSIGMLTVTNDASLNGTTLMEVQSSPSTNDRLRSIQGTITYGGTLVVTNLGPIIGTNTYQLFVGALAGTSFADINLPTLPGVTWNTANLNVNGTITAIQTLNPTPINLSFSLAGNALDISWPADHTGWRLEGQTNGVNIGISNNWVTVPGSTLTNRVVVPVSPANGTVFYRLVLPLP